MRISEAVLEATVPLTVVPSFSWTVACGPGSDELLQAETNSRTAMAEANLICILQSGSAFSLQQTGGRRTARIQCWRPRTPALWMATIDMRPLPTIIVITADLR